VTDAGGDVPTLTAVQPAEPQEPPRAVIMPGDGIIRVILPDYYLVDSLLIQRHTLRPRCSSVPNSAVVMLEDADRLPVLSPSLTTDQL
jgi:hypothetical protein